jgi:hypothetical protein
MLVNQSGRALAETEFPPGAEEAGWVTVSGALLAMVKSILQGPEGRPPINLGVLRTHGLGWWTRARQ